MMKNRRIGAAFVAGAIALLGVTTLSADVVVGAGGGTEVYSGTSALFVPEAGGYLSAGYFAPLDQLFALALSASGSADYLPTLVDFRADGRASVELGLGGFERRIALRIGTEYRREPGDSTGSWVQTVALPMTVNSVSSSTRFEPAFSWFVLPDPQYWLEPVIEITYLIGDQVVLKPKVYGGASLPSLPQGGYIGGAVSVGFYTQAATHWEVIADFSARRSDVEATDNYSRIAASLALSTLPTSGIAVSFDVPAEVYLGGYAATTGGAAISENEWYVGIKPEATVSVEVIESGFLVGKLNATSEFSNTDTKNGLDFGGRVYFEYHLGR